ncbi:MAG: Rho termination factor N-terminal domain-containing protein, partial [Cytophagaceae bacterium]
MYNIEELDVKLLSELKDIAEQLGISNSKKLQKKELIYKILDQQAITPINQLPEKKQTMSTEKTEDASFKEQKNVPNKRPRKRENVKETEVTSEDIVNEPASDYTIEPFSSKNEESSFSIPPL